MKQTIEQAAEQYARIQCDDMYDNIGLTGADWGWETKTDFIAGINSDYNKSLIIYAQIDVLNEIKTKMSFFEIANMENTLDNLYYKILDLEEQLKQLNNG